MLKNIMVVEDTYTHFKHARQVIGERAWERPVETLKIAIFQIRSIADQGDFLPGEFGVLTDLYFPAEDHRGQVSELAPLGMLVMAECQRLSIPCVIVTAGYHHGLKYHEVHTALLKMGWPRMVDSSSGSDKEAEEKNWEQGLEVLEKLAEEIRTGAG